MIKKQIILLGISIIFVSLIFSGFSSAATVTNANNSILTTTLQSSSVSTSHIIPKVVGVNPGNEVIKVTFNEPIKSGPAHLGISVKSSSGKIIPITKTISKNVLLINHTTGTFVKGNKYILYLPKNSISDLANDELPTAFSSSFIIDNTPPNVTANVPGGLYNISKSVTLKINEPGTIYYTTNGTSPTIHSSKYITPIIVSNTETLKYIGNDLSNNLSPIYSNKYTIDKIPPTASVTPPGSYYNSLKTVTLSMSEPGAIYYTVNGNNPTTADTKYINPIVISSTTTLKFIARDLAGNLSPTYTQTYNIDTTIPTASADILGGLYNTYKTVNLSMSEPGNIYYTLDGSTPNTSSNLYNTPIMITSSKTLKYIAVDMAFNTSPIYTQDYTIDTIPPTTSVDPISGTYNNTQSIILGMSEPGNIYYTLDGTVPTTFSTKYTNPIIISSAETLMFFAEDLAGNTSPLDIELYNVNDTVSPTVNTDTIGGPYNTTKTVTLSMSEPGSIYYTINGNDPSTSSNLYTGPITIVTSTTLKYMAVDMANNTSPIYTQIYNIDTIPPTASATPSGSYYNSDQNVIISMSEPGTIYYTTDGTIPTTSSSTYTNPITIASSTNLKYLAIDLAGNKSPIYTDTYTIDTIPPTASATPSGSYYNSDQNVIISMSEPGTIYYTTDGTIPTTSSSTYTNPITIASSTNLKYLAIDLAGNKSPIYTEIYNILPTSSATPTGGLYNSAQFITLIMNEPGTIYYTTDGTTPTNNSNIYTNPLTVTSNTTLKYLAIDSLGNQSPIYNQTYNIDTTPPTVTLIDPSNNAVNVPVNKVINITFNEPIKSGSTYSNIYLEYGNYQIPITKSINNNVLTITPSYLNQITGYSLIMPTNSITDLAGNPLQQYTSSFTTTGPLLKIISLSGSYSDGTLTVQSTITNQGTASGSGYVYYSLYSSLGSYYVSNLAAGNSITISRSYPITVPTTGDYTLSASVNGMTFTDPNTIPITYTSPPSLTLTEVGQNDIENFDGEVYISTEVKNIGGAPATGYSITYSLYRYSTNALIKTLGTYVEPYTTNPGSYTDMEPGFSTSGLTTDYYYIKAVLTSTGQTMSSPEFLLQL